jgi:hypothetical protein
LWPESRAADDVTEAKPCHVILVTNVGDDDVDLTYA